MLSKPRLLAPKINSACFADAFSSLSSSHLKALFFVSPFAPPGNQNQRHLRHFECLLAYYQAQLWSSMCVWLARIIIKHQVPSMYFYLLRFILRFAQCSIKYSETDLIARGHVTTSISVKYCKARESFENFLVEHGRERFVRE